MRNGLALMGFLFILYLLLLPASEGACDTGNTFLPPTIRQFGNNMVLLQYKITVCDMIMAESADNLPHTGILNYLMEKLGEKIKEDPYWFLVKK